jgi:hypothetical protein
LIIPATLPAVAASTALPAGLAAGALLAGVAEPPPLLPQLIMAIAKTTDAPTNNSILLFMTK